MSMPYAMGWQKDLPDIRDFDAGHDEVTKVLAKSGALKAGAELRREQDLRRFCSPIENQGNLGSCTAHAGVGLMEYYENRAHGRFIDASRLFLYKVTRTLLGWTGDTGAWLRTTMKAMVLFGVPPERYYPYLIPRFDDDPGAFCYALAQNFQSMIYYRHDVLGRTGDQVLDQVKRFLSFGYPSMFGFTVYNFGNAEGEFVFPQPGDSVLGGHAVVAVGYNDNRNIAGRKGALLIRNSWGTGWGDEGYGWLPYDYVKSGLASDFWSLIKQEYIDTGKFE